MTKTELLQVFGAKKSGKDKWTARCPSHDDRSRNTLKLTVNEKGMALYCFAGCETRDVVAKAGLRMRDLFFASRDLPSAQLREIMRQRALEENRRREERLHTLQTWLRSANSKPPVRIKDSFTCDIERFCERVLRG